MRVKGKLFGQGTGSQQWMMGQCSETTFATEVALGRKAGLVNQLPFATYVRLLMGIVIKKCSDAVKYHINP